MKIEQLLVLHFYNNREMTLQGMGTFTLSPDFVMPKDSDKDAEIPDNAISFQYNSRATADDALIDFIVQQSRKMRALAAADLDSYLALGRQFLNIGKPFKIDGIGMLLKNQQGELEFTVGSAFHPKMEISPAALKEKAPDKEISFASEGKQQPGNRKGLIIAAAVIMLGLVGTTAWYFFVRKTNNEHIAAADPVLKDSSNTLAPAKADTMQPVLPKPVAASAEGYNFKIVFLVTKDSAGAVARMNALTKRGHQVIMYKNDSTTFKLAEPFKLPLSDTTHIKDSLNNFYFSGKGFIELE